MDTGDSQGHALGLASDYTLQAPNPLDSCTHEKMFYQDFGPPNQFGPRYFAFPAPPLLPALQNMNIHPPPPPINTLAALWAS